MKFTSKDLMKAMGLSIGDRVRVCNSDEVFEVINNGLFIRLHNEENEYPLFYLLNENFEILPRPKRVGDLKCKDFECAKCHLRCLPHCNQMSNAKKTLFNILNSWNEYDTFDQEIYDLLKARLDKVVE